MWFFFDDSGTLHANAPCPFFVYAGYVFLEQAHLDAARRKYRALVKQLKVELNRSDELKACSLTNKYRNKLYKVMRDEQSVSVTVDIERLYDRILSNKKSIVRYKDYVLKRLVKHKIAEMLRAQVLDKAQDITIHIAIDEQLTASLQFAFNGLLTTKCLRTELFFLCRRKRATASDRPSVLHTQSPCGDRSRRRTFHTLNIAVAYRT